MIALDYDSRGKYKTSRGAGIRDKRSRFKALYGEKYALEWPNPSIDYYYDSVSREFLEKDEIRGLSRERAKELRVVSVQLDEDDRARTIYLGDEHALKYLS